MARTAQDKDRLKGEANRLISGDTNVEIDSDETTGENDFKYEQSPNVCAVVVDKGSARGHVQITGGGKEPEMIYTGRGDTDIVKFDILPSQSCMLYGEPTVLYVRPRKPAPA